MAERSGFRFSPVYDCWSKAHSILPFIIRGAALEWQATRWSPEKLAELFASAPASRARFGSRDHVVGKPVYDAECLRAELSVEDFVSWATATSSSSCLPSSPSTSGNSEELESSSDLPDIKQFWGYMDYMHLTKERLEEASPEVAEAFGWSELLGEERGAETTTLWIGTPGAHSPLHYDTMGWNLHTQLSGAKLWILVPPALNETGEAETRQRLRATRLPYEDTTVYSQLDVLGDPWLLSCERGVRVFEAAAGDVLFVPPLWWHSTCCLASGNDGRSHALSVSANTWLSERPDIFNVISEAVTEATVAMLHEAGYINDRCAGDALQFVAADLSSRQRIDFIESELLEVARMEEKDEAMMMSEDEKNDEEREVQSFSGNIYQLRKSGRRRLDSFLSRFSHLQPSDDPEMNTELEKLFRGGSREHFGLNFVRNEAVERVEVDSMGTEMAREMLRPWRIDSVVRETVSRHTA